MNGRSNGGTSYYTYSKASSMPSYFSTSYGTTGTGGSSYSSYFPKTATGSNSNTTSTSA